MTQMSIYQHFRKDEKSFVDSVLDWKENVLRTYQSKRSDFLDPRQQDIIKMVCSGQDDMTVLFDGGYETAERKRALLLPPYIEPERNDFSLTLLKLNYPEKYADITHPNLLGSLMGLGLVRDKFGDLLFHGKTIQFVAATEVADFIRIHLKKVSSFNVTVEEIPFLKIIESAEVWEEGSGTVSSLRLDVVLSEVYNLSRAKAGVAIQQGKVKINWKTTDKPSEPVQQGDYLSLRGFGMSQLFQEDGMTNKGKQRISYRRLKN